MGMIYNSSHYSVMEFGAQREHDALQFGGYQIIDKAVCRECFLNGMQAEIFRCDVQELIANEPSMEEIDEFLAKYDVFMDRTPLLN